MDLGSGRRREERNFDMPLSDLGEPDSALLPTWLHGVANGSSDVDPGFAKWTVQRAARGRRLGPLLLHAEGGGFYIQFQEYASEPNEAEVHFTGKLLDGTVLASSRENDPLIFNLTKDDVMEGFRLAINLMEPGEKAVFTIPQAWTVTKSSCVANIPWNIPPNQRVRFDIELISLITDIFGDQGIKKKTIKFGTGHYKELPLDQDEVLVKYNACLEDGASVSKSEGVEFCLAEGFFCSAFAHVVKTMTKGEEAIVVIKPEYAFGERGRPSTGNETAVPPSATLHVNLQLVSWKEVTRIGENRDIVKRRIRKGPHFEVPRNGAVVKVLLIGKLQDGTVFERRGYNRDDPYLEFTIDEEHVVYGLEEAVMTMVEGEVASFTIPPQHAFGVLGSNQYPLAVIPPNSVVIYEIELLSVVNEEGYWKFPNNTAIAIARKKELEGDDLFSLGKYLRAYRRYFGARQILRSLIKYERQPFDDFKEILISLAFKSAECAIQLQRYKQAIDCYREVLKDDPENPKALQVTEQSFPETPVDIDTQAMHRGLEKELIPPGRSLCGAPNEGRFKYTDKQARGRTFLPPFPRPEPNAGQSSVDSGSNSSTTTNNKNQSSGATVGRKRRASLLGSCFGSSSSN